MPAPERTWADQPFDLLEPPCKKHSLSDPFIFIASDMALAHNTFIRGLNTIYLQAPFVDPYNRPLVHDFLTYCQAWSALVNLHHTQEEDYLFRTLDETFAGASGIFAINISQHDQFENGLVEFERYSWDCLEGDAVFTAKKMREIIDGFASPLLEHFGDEITSLLDLRKVAPGPDVLKIYNEFERRMKKANYDVAKIGPFTALNTDKTAEGIEHPFPGIPAIGSFALKWFISRKYAGAWRFASCDFYGRPQELWMHGEEALDKPWKCQHCSECDHHSKEAPVEPLNGETGALVDPRSIQFVGDLFNGQPGELVNGLAKLRVTVSVS